MNGLDDLHLSFRDWCSDSLPRPWGSTSGLCCVLANGQSSCEGSQAPHGSDRRFLRDECQFSSSHGVRGNLDLHLSLPFPSGLEVIGGVGSLSTGSPSGRGSGYLGLMYSQAPVRSYTKDRAGLQGDHTPKGGGYKVKNRNSSCGNLCRPHWTQVQTFFSCVQARVKQVNLQQPEPLSATRLLGAKASSCRLTELSMVRPKVTLLS